MIRLLAVGKLKSDYYRAGVEDYLRRAGRFARVRMIELPDGDPESEGRQILAKLEGSPIVACDLRGELLDSEGLAQLLGRHGSPCFVVGGPDGLNDAVRERADRLLKLSGFTLPHELARLVLAEQIYRGLTLLRGHPYHR